MQKPVSELIKEVADPATRAALNSAYEDLADNMIRSIVFGRNVIAVLAILIVVWFSWKCFSPAINNQLTAGTSGHTESTSIWLFALAGLYMAGIAIAAIVGIMSAVRND